MISEDLRQLDVARLRAALEKNAGFWDSFKQSLSSSRMGAQAGDALMAAGAAATITGAGVAIKSGVTALRDRIEKPKAFKSMISASPGLKKRDPKGVQMTFNTLYAMNRDMAKDPLVASSFVARQTNRAEIEGGAGAYIEPQTAKMIQDTGASRREANPIMSAWEGGASKSYKPVERSGSDGAKTKHFRSQLDKAQDRKKHQQKAGFLGRRSG